MDIQQLISLETREKVTNHMLGFENELNALIDNFYPADRFPKSNEAYRKKVRLFVDIETTTLALDETGGVFEKETNRAYFNAIKEIMNSIAPAEGRSKKRTPKDDLDDY